MHRFRPVSLSAIEPAQALRIDEEGARVLPIGLDPRRERLKRCSQLFHGCHNFPIPDRAHPQPWDEAPRRTMQHASHKPGPLTRLVHLHQWCVRTILRYRRHRLARPTRVLPQ